MVQRKLASIQRISRILPIVGADSIEQATVMGWNVVVKKGEFSEGDRCVFFEIDSVLPASEKWGHFMAPRNFRVKTVKLRGTLSQGLALPMFILRKGNHGSYKLGDDVTEELGVTKFEQPNLAPDIEGPFPSDIKKTDEIRLQSALGCLDELKGVPFYVTVKLDGMSGTFIRREDRLQVCSRNNSLVESDSAHWAVARKYRLFEMLPVGYAIQGEVCGPKIQNNRLCLGQPDLFVFNVIDVKNNRYFDWDSLTFFCHRHGLKTVPFEFEVDSHEIESFPFTLENFLELAQGEYSGTGNRREGIVVRPMVERRSETLGGDRLSFKVINNDYLLKDED